jgi:hypothetical protein
MHRMLISLIACVALLLFSGLPEAGASDGVEATTAREFSLNRPEDPTTMTLALIGAGTLAVYFACRRTARAGRPVALEPAPRTLVVAVSQAAVPSTAEASEEPSRGAA